MTFITEESISFIVILGYINFIKLRRPTDNELLRFQHQFCIEGFIEDFEAISTASTTMPKDIVLDDDANKHY